MSSATDGLAAVAFMAAGRWVAHCPVCGNAEQAGRCDDGQPGGLEPGRFTCTASDAPPAGLVMPRRGCGWRGPVEWPPDIRDLERVLLARPVSATRNWTPGETLFQLVAENAEHGIVPAAALEAASAVGGCEGVRSVPLLDLVDGQVTAGALEFATAPLQIGA